MSVTSVVGACPAPVVAASARRRPAAADHQNRWLIVVSQWLLVNGPTRRVRQPNGHPERPSTRGSRQASGLAGPELTIAPSSRWPADRPSPAPGGMVPRIARKAMLNPKGTPANLHCRASPVAKTAKLDCRRDGPVSGQQMATDTSPAVPCPPNIRHECRVHAVPATW
jgi:hypothetical protein